MVFIKNGIPWNKGLTTTTPEGNRAYQREWARRNRQNPEVAKRQSQKTREWQKANPGKTAWNQYRTSAKTRGYEFSLTKEDLTGLIFSSCFYCNSEPNPVNGIDRIDNTLGYVLGNSVPCCTICNKAKGVMTLKEFRNWVTIIYNKFGKNG